MINITPHPVKLLRKRAGPPVPLGRIFIWNTLLKRSATLAIRIIEDGIAQLSLLQGLLPGRQLETDHAAVRSNHLGRTLHYTRRRNELSFNYNDSIVD